MPELAEPLAGTADFTLISQGAEAVRTQARCGTCMDCDLESHSVLWPVQRVWEGQFLGRPVIMKQRFRKKYRHPVLDTKLTVGRLNQARRRFIQTVFHWLELLVFDAASTAGGPKHASCTQDWCADALHFLCGE